MNKVISYFLKFIAILTVGYLFLQSIFSTSYISRLPDASEYTYYVKDKPWMYLLLVIVFVIVALVWNKIESYIHVNRKLVTYILYAVMAVVLCAFVKRTQLFPNVDQWYLLDSAISFVNHDNSPFLQGGYIYRYPNQIGLMLLECIPAKFLGVNSYMFFQYLNVFFILGIWRYLGKIVKRLEKNTDMQLVTLIVSIAFLPLSLFVSFVYGTIPGLMFSLAGFYHLLVYFDNRKMQDAVYAVVCLILATVIKSNYLILLIAAVIACLVDLLGNHKWKNLIVMLALCLLYISSGKVMNRVVASYAGVEVNAGIPKIAWVAMGMQSSGVSAPGWFNGYNELLYVNCNFDQKYARDTAEKETFRQIQCRLDDWDYTTFFYGRKIASQWNNPTFQSFWIYSQPLNGEVPVWTGWVKTILENKGLVSFLNVLQTFLLFGTLFYLIDHWKNMEAKHILLPLCIVGGFWFHIIWEAKTQYIMPYYVLLIPMAVVGLQAFVLNLQKAVQNRKYICKAGILCMILIVISGVIAIPTRLSSNAVVIEEDSDLYMTDNWQ